MNDTVLTLLYLVASVFFIFGVKRLSGVRTAAQGNQLAACGMLIAVIVTLVAHGGISWPWVIAGLVIGGGVGAVLAKRVAMTEMPELVGFFNGMGGIASALVAVSVVWEWSADGVGSISGDPAFGVSGVISIALSVLVGSVTFTGSLVAFFKLSGKMSGNPILIPGRHAINVLLLAGALALGFWFATGEGSNNVRMAVLAVAALAFLLGWLLVIPIGGADMPVVISLLNSYSGIAAAMTGFVLHNSLLIISGSLVGASGLILTQIMCKAMNRSLANVLFGGFGAEDSGGGGGGQSGYTKVKSCTADEAAMILENANSVIFVPGYGLAVAQAQHVVKEISDLLESRGTNVKHAIHPVAGRMPGHMNVLLAEAQVPYEQLVEMDDINPEFKNTDVAIVVGANDVVNPVARDAKDSPIYGMPILNCDEVRTCFIIKRSLSPGFAGIDNPLFEADNSLMIFGDAKKVLEDLAKEIKAAS